MKSKYLVAAEIEIETIDGQPAHPNILALQVKDCLESQPNLSVIKLTAMLDKSLANETEPEKSG